MKRNLFMCLWLASSLHGWAQVDISAYFLENHGFDTKFNYDARQTGNVSGDVINEVYGWTNETTATYTVAGTFAYNPEVTFNNSSALPASGYEGSEGGALGLTTGWGMQLVYSQSVTLPKGTYRLSSAYYNVGTSGAGNSLLAWLPDNGTATVSDVKNFPVKSWKTDELIFTLTAQTTGKIRIGFAANEGVGSANHAKILVDYVKLLCDDMDKGGLETALSAARAAYGDGSGVYAEELKAAIDEAQTVYEDEHAAVTDILALTQRLTEATQTYQYKNASLEHPLTMTSRIVNPNFEDGTTGWENDGMLTQTNTSFPGKSGTTYLERWVNIGSKVPDVGIRQTLEGIPDGKYRLRAAVGNIQQNGANSTVNAGEKQTGVTLYAGIYDMPVDTMKVYKDLYFTVVDGQVTIGFKAENATGNWICLDNVRLYYLGGNTSEDYAAYLSRYADDVREELQAKHIQSAVRQAVEAAIEAAEKAAAAENPDEKAMAEAKAALDEAVTAIETSAAVYDVLADALRYAGQVKDWYEEDEEKRGKMETAIQAAQEVWENTEQTEEQIRSAAQALQDVTQTVDKKVYTAQWLMGDVNDPDNAYYIGRTRQSKNWILFWEKGYGENPSVFTCGNHTIDIDEVLRNAEIAFDFYTDSLKFIRRGRSKTDTYKMVIRLRYEPQGWEASGSGVDDLIGLLTLTPWTAPSRNWQTLYHEIGHCFQYQVHCDNGNQNGWMYEPGGGKGCAFWEQCAQWQAYKIMPADQFNNEWFDGYLQNVHKHILHESPRYNNYFIQDYWCYKHGMDFMGRLWNQSRNPEDAVEAYMRLTGITDSEFNDEMYDCAARFATWDIPALEEYGAAKVDSRPLPAMLQVADNYWRISPSAAPENTGHNIIRLNLPKRVGSTVSVCFEGLNRQEGYRVKNATYAEWRYGFVALLKDGSRVYGDMGKSVYGTPKDTIFFDCPVDCKRLYFVVSGGPKKYWRQVWDDNDANDEQWPYQVKFGNTNRYGSANLPDETGIGEVAMDASVPVVSVSGRTLRVEPSPVAAEVRVAALSGVCVADFPCGASVVETPLSPGFYIVQVLSADGRNLVTKKVVVR